MGGVKFGWLGVWVLSQDWLSRILEVCDSHTLQVCDISQELRWSHRSSGNARRDMHRLWIVYTSICLTIEKKLRKTLVQDIRKAFCWTALYATRLVDLAIAGDGLDWFSGPCRPLLARQMKDSTVGQRKYLPICRTRGFPTSANFESKLSVRAVISWASSGAPRSSGICLQLTYQSASVAKRRHLDCNNFSLRTWVRAADLHAGHA